MSTHSVAAPSSLGRTEQCPGSVRMQQQFPEDVTSEASLAAAEGTAAHWAMAELMAERPVQVGQRADNGIALTAEMIEAAELLVDDVLATITPHGMTLAHCVTERRVAIPRVHAECWGTPDVRVWLPGNHLVVWDLKFGFRHVPVFENRQLIAYSVGAIDERGASDLAVRVTNKIVQPRSYSADGPVRSWSYNAAQVRALVNLMNMAVTEALGPNPRTRVGPECRDCRAAHACTTLQRAAENAMDLAGSAMPHQLPAHALGVELRNINRAFDLLKARRDALEEQALAMSRRGERIPLFRVKQGTGRLKWTKPDAEVLALGQVLGVNLGKPSEAITPGQAARAGVPEALIQRFAARAPGAVELLPDDGSDFRRIFANKS